MRTLGNKEICSECGACPLTYFQKCRHHHDTVDCEGFLATRPVLAPRQHVAGKRLDFNPGPGK